MVIDIFTTCVEHGYVHAVVNYFMWGGHGELKCADCFYRVASHLQALPVPLRYTIAMQLMDSRTKKL